MDRNKIDAAHPMATHRSVAGIAVKDERIFIARRNPGGSMGGRWEFPGGKVESGEDDTEALKREYLEEFGISIQVGECLAGAHFEHKNEIRILSAYRVWFEQENIQLMDHTEWRWVHLEEIDQLEFADSDRKLLHELRIKLQIV